jgi:hypothetical protein
MSAATDLPRKWLAWPESGTTVTTSPTELSIGLYMSEYVATKPVKRNTSVEKKIRRRGWSKQFFEK